MYWDDVGHHLGETLDRFWMTHPEVRARINTRVSGDPACWPTQWFRARFAGRLPLRRALSVGCGTGSLERDLVRQGIVLEVTGIDVAPQPLEVARAEAEKAGMGHAITYRVADAREHLRQSDGLDAVFFHGSLHHFDRLGELLGLVRRALQPEGLLYLDEYVGPSMREWGPRLLFLPNLLYYLLPKSLRRPRLVRAPVNREDPTEMVCAGEILGAVEDHFRVLERRDYGGDLLALIYPNLRRPGEGPEAPALAELDDAVRFLLDCEELLLRYPRITRSRPYHTVLVASPRT
jgi:SAM-dependent methyltransferase